MPVITSASFTLIEDEAYLFVSSNFTSRYSDPEDDPLASIRISSAPVYGALLLGDALLFPGYRVSLSEIAAGMLRFVPPADASGPGIDHFDFVAIDATGAEAATATTFSFDVVAVNDAPSFMHGDGMASTPIEPGISDDMAQCVRVQADGKIVVAGSSVKSQSGSDFAVVRYNADGTLDTSFSGDGKVTTTLGSVNNYASGVSLQADGKIVVAGYMVKSASDSDFAVVRYNSDGSLDTSFSVDGKVTNSMGSSTDHAYCVAVQPDGKLVVAGYTDKNAAGTDSDFAVARFSSDGSLDKSFSGDGKATASLGSLTDYAYSVAVQPDGKIVMAGSSAVSSVDSDFAVVRYNSDGMLDKSFSGDGKVTTSLGAFHDVARSVAVQADGKIVVAGYSFVSDVDADFAVVRYDSDGTLDTSFGGTGKVITPIAVTSAAGCSMILQHDGKILVAGYADNGTDRQIALVRYNSDGTLDTAFDGDGIALTPVGAMSHDSLDLTLQPDGKIVVAGSVWNGVDNDFLIVRYHPDGTLDTGFDALDTLGGTVLYTEGDGPGVTGTPVVLDADVQVFDVELDARGRYGGATLSLFRHGGANAEDRFSAAAPLGELGEGSELTIDGVVIGTVTTNSNGALQLDFSASATGELANHALRSIAYANSSDAPPPDVVIDWHFSDGAATSPQSATGSTTVRITGVNDAPTSTDKSVSAVCTLEKVFGVADFGVYHDAEGAPLSAVKITSLPEIGVLFYSSDGTTWNPLSKDQSIDIAGIADGHLKYVPEAGQTSVTIGFQVSDGSLYSESAYILTVEVQQSPHSDFRVNITYWSKGEGIEGVTAILTDVVSNTDNPAFDNGGGQYDYVGVTEQDYVLSATKEAGQSDIDAVSFGDALSALKIALGRNPNSAGQTVSPYQYLAADVDHNGKVEAADALGILKTAIGIDHHHEEWAFVSESVGNEPMDSNHVTWPATDIVVTLDHDTQLDLVGVLLGDVDGSWIPRVA
jgi:uncharacterized delta-60 repeat protein